jgi:hydroxyacylglutathione hydrolase
VALAGPRREQHQDPRAAVAAQRVALVRFEAHQDSGARLDHVATHGYLHRPVEHGDPGVLLHLMVAERLAGLQHDQHRAGAVVGVEDDRISRSVGGVELEQIPALHEQDVFPSLDTLKRSMPLAVDSYVMGPFQSNCYVVRAEDGAAVAAIVDPGDDPTPLRLELERLGTTPGGILVTHTDVDHIGGVAALAEGTGAEVWAPAGEVEDLRSGSPRGGFPVAPHDPAHVVTGGDQITVAGISFDVIDVPGHSRGHVAFHHDGELFVGDVLFAGSVGRYDLPGGDWETLLESLRSLFERFAPETIVYPGHGPATTLGDELQSNPFLAELRA